MVQRHDAAGLEHGNAPAQGLGLFQIVRGQQNGVALFVEFGDELPQRLAQFHVHAGRGLIQHDHRRLVHQGLRHQHPALHAARELAHIGVGLVGQAQAFQQLVNPGVVVLHAEIARLDAQSLAHIEKGVKHEFLRHHTQAAPGGGIVFLHIVAQDAGRTAAGPGQAREHADHGGFARAIGAEQAKKLAFLNAKADIVNR